jgi:hypothetical protein
MAEYKYLRSENADMRYPAASSGRSGPFEVWHDSSKRWVPYDDKWDVWHTGVEISKNEADYLISAAPIHPS